MRRILVAIFAVLATAAALTTPLWGGNWNVGFLVPGAELDLSERLARDARVHDYAGALATTDPASRPNAATLDGIAATFPGPKEDAIRVTAWHKLYMGGEERTQIVVFYDFGARGAVRATFHVLKNTSGQLMVQGADFTRFSQSALHVNDFRFPAAAGDIRWVLLALALLFDLLAFASFAHCLSSPLIRWRWRWLWALFTLCGVVRFDVDWMSLAWQYNALSLLGPPAVFSQFFSYGPWVLSLTVPIGAPFYWLMWRRWRYGTDFAPAAADIRGG